MQVVQNPPIWRMNMPKEVQVFIVSFCIFGYLRLDSRDLSIQDNLPLQVG